MCRKEQISAKCFGVSDSIGNPARFRLFLVPEGFIDLMMLDEVARHIEPEIGSSRLTPDKMGSNPKAAASVFTDLHVFRNMVEG
jgi:hypothetical protein